MTMQAIAGLEAATYRPHALHAAGREWTESNCSVDLMIELLAALGRKPEAGLGFTTTLDFEGDQFTFFKFPNDDLRDLFGLHVLELSLYDDLAGHVGEQLARGRIVLLEVDAWHLPDTRGVSWRSEHTKTTIGVNALDSTARRIGYFHNAGYYELAGEDFDAIFPAMREGLPLFPYCEFVKVTAARNNLVERALSRLAAHLSRRPQANPFESFAKRLPEQAEALAARPPAAFHKYAFNTLRQAGANFELLASHLEWLTEHGVGDLDIARKAATQIAVDAKALQFQLARAAARRRFDGLAAQVGPLAASWERVMTSLARRQG